jgi:hypothetical protein
MISIFGIEARKSRPMKKERRVDAGFQRSVRNFELGFATEALSGPESYLILAIGVTV